MPADLSALTADLVAETAWLDEILGALPPAQWQLRTPAPGWTIADQVSHLAYFDEATLLSIRDPELFRRDAEALAGRAATSPTRSPPSTATSAPPNCCAGSGPPARRCSTATRASTAPPGCPGTAWTWGRRRRSRPG